MGNIPLEFVNKDLWNHSHEVQEEGFPPVDHGKHTTHDVRESHRDCAHIVGQAQKALTMHAIRHFSLCRRPHRRRKYFGS